MTAILGISAFYHDSAAALVVDGVVVAAAQEERFSREKHDAELPHQAIQACLDKAGLTQSDLDYVAYYEKPLQKFERLLETYLAVAPAGFRSFATAMPLWLHDRLRIRKQLRAATGNVPLVFVEHHQSHAASAFFPSPFDNAAYLTVDGVGEWSTATWGVGHGNLLTENQQICFPHSLGLLYSAFTYHCGFAVNDGEYKLMGLAPFGKPVYVDTIRRHLIEIHDDGSFWMNMRFFNYCQGLTMTNQRFSQLLGIPVRAPESEIEQSHRDLAASVQVVVEEILLRMANHIHQQTGLTDLVLAGGVALNCVANGRLLREGPFQRIWVQPAAGDAGGALGAALLTWYELLGNSRSVDESGTVDHQVGSLLGPAFDDATIATVLDKQNARYHVVDDAAELSRQVACSLSEGQVVGWFQGGMEFGPRALGNRSLLADARSPQMQARLNRAIKRRESFRPFAPIVLQEYVSQWFDLAEGVESPYMSFVAGVKQDGIPAITHVDRSARVQSVDDLRNPKLHRLLTAFHKQTDCPVLVNTSFNVRGEPIVCTPQDAYRCFMGTEIDLLVMGNCLLHKSENLPSEAGDSAASPDRDSVSVGQAEGVAELSPLLRLLHAAHGRWMRLAHGISWLIAQVLLALVFGLLVTPIGLALRVCRYDPLLKKRPGGASFWRSSGPRAPRSRYLKQY